MNDKMILFFMTAILDLLLLNILLKEDNKKNDKFFIYVALISHLIFFYALSTENKNLLDILHVLIIILPLFSIFISNKNIKLIVIGLLVSIKILWMIKGKCIMRNLPTNFKDSDFGNFPEIFITSLFSILMYQIKFK